MFAIHSDFSWIRKNLEKSGRNIKIDLKDWVKFLTKIFYLNLWGTLVL